ncbi:MAG: hypothetical protein Q9190_000324 [Brigantiaea leucoxantha]
MASKHTKSQEHLTPKRSPISRLGKSHSIPTPSATLGEQQQPVAIHPLANSINSSTASVRDKNSDPSACVSGFSEGFDFENHWRGQNPSERSEVVYTGKKQPAAADEHFEIVDPSTIEFELAGWDGKFQPPPIEWHLRDQFNSRKLEHIERIKGWVICCHAEHKNSPCLLETKGNEAYTSGDALAIGENNFATPPPKKAHHTVRSEDPFTMSHISQTAGEAAKNYVAKKKKHKTSMITRAEKRAYREELKKSLPQIFRTSDLHKPKANIYIRPAEPVDMGQICHIYNYYVRTSVVVEDLFPTQVSQWRNVLAQTVDEKFAFIVAVMMGGRGRSGFEEIVGFSFAESHTSEERSSYSYFCEMQVYTSAKYPHQGIGKSLVDRMVFSLDAHYHNWGGCEFRIDDRERTFYEFGGRSTIKNILIKVMYDADDEREFQKVKDWLKREFEFEHVGTMPRVGRKLDKQ